MSRLLRGHPVLVAVSAVLAIFVVVMGFTLWYPSQYNEVPISSIHYKVAVASCKAAVGVAVPNLKVEGLRNEHGGAEEIRATLLLEGIPQEGAEWDGHEDDSAVLEWSPLEDTSLRRFGWSMEKAGR